MNKLEVTERKKRTNSETTQERNLISKGICVLQGDAGWWDYKSLRYTVDVQKSEAKHYRVLSMSRDLG